MSGHREMKRRVFFVSDRTGITVETLGQSLLTQFPGFEFATRTLPFVTNQAAAYSAAETIRAATREDGLPPLVFSTLTDPATQYIIASSGEHVFDLFGTFIEPLEGALGRESSHTAGRMHGIGDILAYERRLTALNFTLSHDDGLGTRDLHEAEIVLVGVSRCGKTPTCLYLSMHYSLKAGNYPLTDDDFEQIKLPKILESSRRVLYGLTILPEQLSRIRSQRRPEGGYSTLAQCQSEVARAEQLFRKEGIPYLDTTTVSIEEIAATIVRDKGLR
ncbi:MAG: kinase/pyrophosphorylase [Gammaproteobacteria bacterium]|nr:kinase/pyrophosphorylase [Gammaproteobacteria bacterium]